MVTLQFKNKINQILKEARYVLGLEDFDFVNRRVLGRRCIERFIRHMHHLDLSMPTIIEAGKTDIPEIRSYRYFPDSHYMYYNTVRHFPAFNFYNPRKKISEFRPFNLAEKAECGPLLVQCKNYGFPPPYIFFIELSVFANKGAVNEIRLALQECHVIFLYIDQGLFVNYLDNYSLADDLLRAEDFIFHDCLDMQNERKMHDNLYMLVYVKNGHKLLNRYQQAKSEPRYVSVAGDVKQKNCLILGLGRSGTSMLGGILYQAGYYMGENIYPGRETNPKGFFECLTINFINEMIMEENHILEDHDIKSKYSPNHKKGQGWLSIFPVDEQLKCDNPSVYEKIREMVSRQPFCYKDPRFSYTLPVWLQCLDLNTVFICVFRDPGKTVNSILAECQRMPYLRDLVVDRSIVYQIYENVYRHVINYSNDTDRHIVFVHYNQIISGEGIEILSTHLDIEFTGDFVDKELDRAPADNESPPAFVLSTYKELCKLAAYS